MNSYRIANSRKTIAAIVLGATGLVACRATGDGEIAGTAAQAVTGTVRIDFDHRPDGIPIPDGTMMDQVYASEGVTFSTWCAPPVTSNVPGCDGHAWTHPLGTTGDPTDGVTMADPYTPFPYQPFPNAGGDVFNEWFGSIWVSFDAPVFAVSIDASAHAEPGYGGCSDPTNCCTDPVSCSNPLQVDSSREPYLDAFDAAGNFIERAGYPVDYGHPHFGEWRTLTVGLSATSPQIAKVSFSAGKFNQGGYQPYGRFDNLVVYGSSPPPPPPPPPTPHKLPPGQFPPRILSGH